MCGMRFVQCVVFCFPSHYSWYSSPECLLTLKCLSCVSIYNWLSWIFADDLLYLAEWLMAPVFHRSMSGSEHAISLLQLDIQTPVQACQQAAHKCFVFVFVLEHFLPNCILQVHNVVLSLHHEGDMWCFSGDACKACHFISSDCWALWCPRRTTVLQTLFYRHVDATPCSSQGLHW